MGAYLTNRARREREALTDHLEIHHQ